MTIKNSFIGAVDESSRLMTDPYGTRYVTGDDQAVTGSHPGEITLPGRHKETINRAGENVSPSFMERMLSRIERDPVIAVSVVSS